MSNNRVYLDDIYASEACKGSTFKGPFHVPRCLILVDQMMTQILEG